jgi:hypothetical protein
MSQRRSGSGWIRPYIALIALLMPCLPGCGSCGASSSAVDPKAGGKDQPDEAKKEKPKEDFELSGLKVLPHEEKPSQFVKPGHWSTATQQIKANNFDFAGELEGETVDPEQSPIDMPGTALYLTTSRPALLPKGQEKFLDLSFFVPAGALRSRIASRLLTQGGGRAVLSGARDPLVTLHPHQFEFVILTPDPSRYSYFKLLDSLRFRLGDADGAASWAEYYKVLALKSDPKVPLALPTHWLSWTTIAGLLIDDFDPASLSPEQQQALVDWLHWGGQILVSGPDTLDRLKGTFLAPYLPVQAGAPLEIDNEDLGELNQAWTIEEKKHGRRELSVAKPWNGVTLVSQPGATPETLVQTPTGQPLVVEGRAGRGRIVVTAFRLSERALLNWPHFDSFINGALLRRPPREYLDDGDLSYRLRWVKAVDERDAKFTDRRYDGRLVSQLRIFTRDALDAQEQAHELIDDLGLDLGDADLLGSLPQGPINTLPAGSNNEAVGDSLYSVGVATWNDARGVSNVARAALRKAAGIQIPDRQFVLYVLAGYLTILVPVNYIVFRLMGRLEWAWIAVPIIAIGGAATVIKLARLDIGFASSQTELAVLEAHGGYARGHVTRFSALYSSLSTAFDLHYADLTAVAAPFSADPDFVPSLAQSSEAAAYRRDKDVRLDNLNVISNSTSMVRAEHMLDLGGAIRLLADETGNWRLENKSNVALSDVRILRRAVDRPAIDAQAALGEVAAGATKPVEFSAGDVASAPVSDDSQTSAVRLLDLAPLMAVAADPLQMDPGEVRLVARIAERLPGAETSPSPSQISTATLAVIHLIPGQGRTPAPDVNAKSELNVQPAFDVLQSPPNAGPAGAAPQLPASGLPATGLPVVPSTGPAVPAPTVPTIDPNAAPAITAPATSGQP